MKKTGILSTEQETKTISLNISTNIKNYIDDQTSNRSEWLREAGNELMPLLYDFLVPYISSGKTKKEVVSIGKPTDDELEAIYKLITDYGFFYSRSEFYRFSAIFKIIIENMKSGEEREKQQIEDIVKIPMGNNILKTYKIIKRLEY